MLEKHGSMVGRAALAVLLALFAGRAAAQVEFPFVRGDLNGDGQVTLADASHYFAYRFLGAPPPGCSDAADVNDDGSLDTRGIADGQFLLDWLFRTALPAPLPAPFPARGADPTPDALSCAEESARNPPGRTPGYGMDWEAPAAIGSRARDVELFLLATTAAATESASIAYRVRRDVVTNLRVDLERTIVPARLAERLAASALFRWLVLPSADPEYDLLVAGMLFLVETSTGYEQAAFPATAGSLGGARLFRVLADVRAGAPLGPAEVLTPALPEDFIRAGSFLHGIQNEFGGAPQGLPGGNFPIAGPLNVQIIHDGEEFLRGDANSDGKIDISDPLMTLGFLFTGGAASSCPDAADANDDGTLNIADPTYTLGYLFLGTAAPPPPGALACGFDPTSDGLPPCVKGCP
jgi:hypothetical protein